MKVSYNWLKWYIPDAPDPEKLSEVLTFHVCEVESMDKLPDGDVIFDAKILPNRGHDLLSHQGIARELASVLNIKFVDPTPKYKVPESKPTELKVEIKTDACKRYMGRIIRNVKITSSPEWVVKHLESIGQRSINNIVDATNIVMFDCGEPTHVFDFDKVKGAIIARPASEGEKITTLDGKEVILTAKDFVVADREKALILGGVKGGKAAEVDANTKNIILEVGNFDAVTVRKTSTRIGIRTDGSKRWENGVSPELASHGMLELSALITEMCPDAIFEDVVDVYPYKQEERKITISLAYINKRLGTDFTREEVKDVWVRMNFEYTEKGEEFEIKVPPLRLDLIGPHDLTEDVINILGYDRIEEKLPYIKLESKISEKFLKMSFAREKLLNGGYSEVMTYVFRDDGEVEVLASASDKKFLRTNLSDGLKDSLKLNKINSPLLGMNEIKIFEIGTVFNKKGEEMHVAYNEGEKIIEKNLDEFVGKLEKNSLTLLQPSAGTFHQQNSSPVFRMWSLFPFISRDISVWVPAGENSENLKNLLKENGTDLLIKEPYLVDSFTGKDGRTSYAFRLVFQSYERTLTDAEINEIMAKITNKIKDNSAWQVR